jgi:hypothetical protein
MSNTSYEEFDRVLDEVIEGHELSAERFYLKALEGEVVSSADIDEFQWVNDQIVLARWFKTIRNVIGEKPPVEGLQEFKEQCQKHNKEGKEAEMALCDRLIFTLANPTELCMSVRPDK